MLSVGRRSDGRFRSVDEGLGLSGRRSLSGSEDLADDLVAVGQLDGMFRRAGIDQGTSGLLLLGGGVRHANTDGDISALNEVLAVLIRHFLLLKIMLFFYFMIFLDFFPSGSLNIFF